MKKDFSPTLLDFGPLRIYLARHFGFCYGVENAIDIAFRTIEENPGKRIFLLSEMIHNPQVNADLKNRGVQFLQDNSGKQIIPFDHLSPEDIVLIPAFGTTLEIERNLRSIGIHIERYDTTCPFVEKVWNRGEAIAKEKYTIIIHGKPTHEETRATFSHASATAPSIIVRDLKQTEELAKYITGEKPAEEFYSEFKNQHSKNFNVEKKLFWLGELDPLENPEYMQVFDAAYTWTWMHKTEEFYKKGMPVSFLDTILEKYESVPGMKAWFTSNHDENSWNGTEYEKYGEAAKALAVLSCTWPGIPLIYNGQELPNHKRLKFFEKDTIEWKDTYLLHDFYKTLLTLHAHHPALNGDANTAPVYRLHTSAGEHILAYLRKKGKNEVLVLLNLSNKGLNVSVDSEMVKGKFTDVFNNIENDFEANNNITLAPWSYFVGQK